MCWGLIWRCPTKRVFKIGHMKSRHFNQLGVVESIYRLSWNSYKFENNGLQNEKKYFENELPWKSFTNGSHLFFTTWNWNCRVSAYRGGSDAWTMRKVIFSWKHLFSPYFFRAKEQAKKFKDDLVSKSFYRFDYHEKVCENLGKVFNQVKKKLQVSRLKTFRHQMKLVAPGYARIHQLIHDAQITRNW